MRPARFGLSPALVAAWFEAAWSSLRLLFNESFDETTLLRTRFTGEMKTEPHIVFLCLGGRLDVCRVQAVPIQTVCCPFCLLHVPGAHPD
jgi:hypothetical protein